MTAIFTKEIRQFFSTFGGVLIFSIFLLLNSIFLWISNAAGTNILSLSYSNIDGLFFLSPFLFIIFIPTICMKLFSEEFNSGTSEILLTKAISTWRIVLGKYFASIALLLIFIIPTFFFPISVSLLSDSEGIDLGGLIGSYIGLFLLGAIFCSIGIFTSALSSNNISSLILSVILCSLLFFGFDIISKLSVLKNYELLISNFGISPHYKTMSMGLISLKDTVYFISTISFFLIMTETIIKLRKQ